MQHGKTKKEFKIYKTLNNIIVTRHLFEIDEKQVSDGVSNICAISPGVMGTTGIETSDIVKAIVDKIDLDYIIVVDALKASEITRVNKTIQITNSGISPGSGVGNKRKELSQDILGIPVIAIGVPTVVDAATLVNDTMDKILESMTAQTEKGSDFYQSLFHTKQNRQTEFAGFVLFNDSSNRSD